MKWEYKSVLVRLSTTNVWNTGANELVGEANGLGQEGWELVSTISLSTIPILGAVLLFKRPLK